jgi:hypothetical protein
VVVVASTEAIDVDVVEVTSVDVTDVDIDVGTFGGHVTEISLVLEDTANVASLDVLPEDIAEVVNPVEDKLED